MLPPMPYPVEPQEHLQTVSAEQTSLPMTSAWVQAPESAVIAALPVWVEEGENAEHKDYILNYHTAMCQQFANGFCPRHQKGWRSTQSQCFSFHFDSQRRRQLVDEMTGRLRYWDVLCERVTENEECPFGDLCAFAHTREEISYHAAKYKTKLCNDRDCRGQEVCCFAHGKAELRTAAVERYSFWSVCGGGGVGTAADPCSGAGFGGDAVLFDGELPVGPRGVLQEQSLAALGLAGGGAVGGRGAASVALYHPTVYKHRFCASYPNISGCRRGEACAFAHTREEIRTPLLDEAEEAQLPSSLTDEFFMYRFKTFWCPIGVQHDWQTCVYAHNYQDARRNPGIGYGPRPCRSWKRKETALEYSDRCPLGVRCPFSHGAKEQLYHPSYFKTVVCQDRQDWPNACPRGQLCAFYHKRSQQRHRPEDDLDYKQPLPEPKLQEALQIDFLSPPFRFLNALQAESEGHPPPPHADDSGEASYASTIRQQFALFTGGPPQPESFLCLGQSQDFASGVPWTAAICGVPAAVAAANARNGTLAGGTPTTASTAGGADVDESISTSGSDKRSEGAALEEEMSSQTQPQGGHWVPLSPHGWRPGSNGYTGGFATMCYVQGGGAFPVPLDPQVMMFPSGGNSPFPAEGQPVAISDYAAGMAFPSGGHNLPSHGQDDGGGDAEAWCVQAFDSTSSADASIPTYNGFVHFRDTSEGSDVDEASPTSRRPRANSH